MSAKRERGHIITRGKRRSFMGGLLRAVRASLSRPSAWLGAFRSRASVCSLCALVVCARLSLASTFLVPSPLSFALCVVCICWLWVSTRIVITDYYSAYSPPFTSPLFSYSASLVLSCIRPFVSRAFTTQFLCFPERVNMSNHAVAVLRGEGVNGVVHIHQVIYIFI